MEEDDFERLDRKMILSYVRKGKLDDLLSRWKQAEEQNVENIRTRTQMLLALEANPKLKKDFDSIIRISEAFAEAARDVDSAVKKVLRELESLDSEELQRILSHVAQYAAETENWQVIRSLLDHLPHGRDIRSHLAQEIMTKLYYLTGSTGSRGQDTEELTSCILHLLQYIEDNDLDPYVLNRQRVWDAIRSRDQELVEVTLVDLSHLHERGYASDWSLTESDLKTVINRYPENLDLFLEHLKNVGSPFYEKAVAYTIDEDV